MATLELRVLGPPQVHVDGVPRSVSGRQLLLAVRLALARGGAVPSARLRDDIGADGSAGALRVVLTRLRAASGADAVERVDGGYALVAGTRLDADRFEALVHAARQRGDSIDRRLAALDEALALWRGSALEGLEPMPWVRAEAVRLDELREHAVDDRFELRSLVEDPARLVADLRAATDAQPTRERRAELLATALYRAGRQRDALQAIASLRTHLLDELGLSPGPGVHALELRILQQDPALLHLPLPSRAARAAEVDSRLRAAVALMKAGALSDAQVIVDEAADDATRHGDRAVYARVLLARAQAVALAGEGEPHELIDEAQTIARELRDGPLLAQCALARFGSGVRADRTAALVELTEPLELLPMGAPQRLELLCAAAVVVTFIDASEAADRLLDAAQRTFDRLGSRRAEAVWLAARSLVGAVRGVDIEQVDAWAARSYELARELDDPTLRVMAIQAVLRARYMRADVRAIDAVLDDLERASHDAVIPFGMVRVHLCRTSNAMARGQLDVIPAQIEAARREGMRLRTFSAAGAALSQHALLLYELGRDEELAAAVAAPAARGPGVWHAVLALCGRFSAAQLLDVADEVPLDDSYLPFVALAAEVAARERDLALGAWCAPRLDAQRDLAVTAGLGSVVLGFAAHYAGLAHLAVGDVRAAIVRLERARALGIGADAPLWAAHAAVELAAVLASSSDRVDIARAEELRAETAAVVESSGSVRLARRHAAVRAALDGSG